MNWAEQNLQILATLGSALAVYIFIRLGSRTDVRNVEIRLDKLESNIDEGFKDIRKDMHQIEMRLTRLEGRFDERGYWESRKTGTEEK